MFKLTFYIIILIAITLEWEGRREISVKCISKYTGDQWPSKTCYLTGTQCLDCRVTYVYIY